MCHSTDGHLGITWQKGERWEQSHPEEPKWYPLSKCTNATSLFAPTMHARDFPGSLLAMLHLQELPAGTAAQQQGNFYGSSSGLSGAYV